MVNALYDALKAAGVDETLARNAAQSVLGVDDKTELATKQDLAELKLAMKADLAELKASLIVWGVGVMFTAMGVYSAIMVAIFRSFAR
jgi:hypothetical protein